MSLPFRIGFESPGYLLCLAVLPLIWYLGWRHLGVLGPVRRWVALLARTLVWAGIVAALAGIQLVWTSDRVTVMYVLDQSESIPLTKRTAMLDFVIAAVSKHRNDARGDRAGLIVFGRDATIEIPPYDDDVPPMRRLESLLERTDATNLEAALNLAQASMPEDTARRIVIVTDGNENIGQARSMASRLADAGIGIDIVPVISQAGEEVLVEKIDLPSNIRKGQPFEARIVIDRQGERGNASGTGTDDAASSQDDDGAGPPVRGRLRVKQVVGGEESLLLEQTIELAPGKNVFPMRHTIDQPAAYTYEAEFIADSEADDVLTQNNSATGYTYVRGKGRILLIHSPGKLDDYELMMSALRDANIEVTPMSTDRLFGSIAELQPYDAVILGGVPRVDSDSSNKVSSFTDAQIEMLVRNTQQLGAGLMMIGGPDALGAGGWTGTEIEKAMPVDFKIRNAKVNAVGALALIMHASEMAQGNYWQKKIAEAAITQLGGSDLAGVLHWSPSGDKWLWGGSKGLLQVGPNRKAMLASLGRMTPGDMPEFDPAMRMAVAGLARTSAAMKHCIIISDGDPSPPSSGVIKAFKDNNITVSTVAVESHGTTGSTQLRKIAQSTGGKYYEVKSGRALPAIFQREARRVSRPLVFEPEGGALPEVVFPHVALDGIDTAIPPIRGFVMTQTKSSPLAQVVLRSPKPETPENATVLATWNYGLGRTAVLTTDAGQRWAAEWVQWPGYEKLHSQLVRWLMRPTGDTGQFSLATQVNDGQVDVIVTALSDDDQFLNFLEVAGSVLDPSLEPLPLRMEQVAPGRYSGSFPIDRAGTYFVNVLPGSGNAPLSTGVTVPYSDEFRYRQSNQALMAQLASLSPKGGQPGEVTAPLDEQVSDAVLASDAFRGGLPLARRIRDAWPWFVLIAAGLFFTDVLVRRVAIRFGFLKTWWDQWTGKGQPELATVARLDQLKQQKDAINASSAARRSGTRFDPTSVPAGIGTKGGPAETTLPGKSEIANDSSDTAKEPTSESSYTERLLEAKRRARKK
ncbi:putative membrane protein/Mg-chelatase subunit ChlD [Rhodopirellula rubra]|uniref:Putative membrane protein/Mg-chelatase subunit ChlD n=1 Tax=Aporhodopirellula rubra TaxID=980271 RepID=A0A7W5E4N3_9BACT|nr:VWA domain-containing protein [Aporhodopirellula rubra]MBB3209772.1 putative membrane protein/Mg-chelatase subunit ChlD [Aporhodopirellula rubra]